MGTRDLISSIVFVFDTIIIKLHNHSLAHSLQKTYNVQSLELHLFFLNKLIIYSKVI